MTGAATSPLEFISSNRIAIRLLLSLLAFFSGAGALVFQTIWARSFGLIFGSTVQSTSAVFASFLAGLAIGAFCIGRISKKIEHKPLQILIIVEIMIAVSATAIGFVLHQNNLAIGSFISGHSLLGMSGMIPLITFLFLCFPTFLMGATLPLLIESAKDSKAIHRDFNLLYGSNVLGAAIGTFVTGFFLIRYLGVLDSLWIACALDILAAMIGILLLLICKPYKTEKNKIADTGKNIFFNQPPEWVLWVCAFLSGVIILSLEVVWLRLTSYFVGNRTFAFSVVVSTFLLLLAMGPFLISYMLERYKNINVIAVLTGLFLASVVGITVSIFLFDVWLPIQDRVESVLIYAQNNFILFKFSIAFLFLMPACIPLAMIFPFIIVTSNNFSGRPAKSTGFFYFINTVGVVIGSLATGFFFIEFSGSYGTIYILTLICVVMTLILYFLKKVSLKTIFIPVCAIFFVFFNPATKELNHMQEAGEILFKKEDENGILQVISSDLDKNIIVTNNGVTLIYRLGREPTAYVQQMQGHLGMMYHPDAKRVLIIGAGYGVTAGALTLYRDIEHIDVAEILPLLIESVPFYKDYNFKYYEDPRVSHHIGDGRHFLVRNDKKYDIISSNLTTLGIPGSANFFTRDFYQLAKQHLNDDGIYIQHIFARTEEELALAYKTLISEFPFVYAYQSYNVGYNIIASMKEVNLDSKRIRSFFDNAKLSKTLGELSLTRENIVDFLNDQAKNPAFDNIDEMPLITDDRPYLEFYFHSGNQRRTLDAKHY